MKRFLLCTVLASAVLLTQSALADFIESGRTFDEDKRFSFRGRVGKVDKIEGGVEETTRRLFTVTGQDDKQDNAESYSFEELGISDSDITYGLQVEYMWKYFTLEFDASYLHADVSGTAQDDYFIGVDEVDFGGQTYEYQTIPKGTQYEADLDGSLVGLRGFITPFTINSGGAIQVVPWIELGLFALLGTFEVDAGEATGVQEYENPPRDYVIGGRSEGDAAVAVPEIGAGGEVTLRLGSHHGQPVNLVLQGNYAIFEFEGDSDDLGISSRNDKDLDIDYDTYRLTAMLEVPISRKVDFIVGGEYRVVSAEGDSRAKERSEEETLTKREKFDKHIVIDLTILNALIGFRW